MGQTKMEPKLRFGISTLLGWVSAIAVCCLPIVYGGVEWTVVSFFMLVFAACFFFRRFILGGFCVAIALMLVGLAAVVMPRIGNASQAARRNGCLNNVRSISLAVLNYESTYGHFPPAYQVDENGVPMHSWRVLILPFLGEQELYEKYDFNEPWDGPNNSKLAAEIPKCFQCPEHPAGPGDSTTNYVAVIGQETMWPFDRSRKIDEVTDGVANTLLIVESDKNRTHWMRPGDVSLAKLLLGNQANATAISSKHSCVAVVGFADCHTLSVSQEVDRATLKGFLTVAGGEVYGELDL